MQLKSLMRGLFAIAIGLLPGAASAQHATGNYTQIVTKAAGTITTVTSSLNPSTYTDKVTFTLAVPAGSTGTVQFLDGGNPLGAPVTIAGGVAQFSTTTLSVSTHPITASYSGDSNFAASTTSGTLSQIVNKNAGTIALVSGTNPSTFSQSVTFTATLPTGASGIVTFYDNGVSIGTGTAATGATTTATFTTTTLTAGTHPITAQYAGDGNFAPITTSNTVQQVVNKATNGTNVLTYNPPAPIYGQTITFTDTLNSNATGTVSFFDGSTLLGTGTITNGVATFATTTPLSAGTHTITAQFPGDTNYPASTGTATVTIGKQTGANGLSAALTSSNLSVPAGTNVTFTVTLPKDATGTVQFFDGATAIGAPQTVTSGVATFATSTLSVGTHPISAQYSGDNNYSNVTSNTIQQVITAGTATVTIAGVPNPSVYGGNVVMTITVTGVNNVSPTGTVQLTYAGANLGGALPLTAGPNGTATATYNTATLPAGSDVITATYSGDSNYK